MKNLINRKICISIISIYRDLNFFRSIGFLLEINAILGVGIDIFIMQEMSFKPTAATMCGADIHKQLVKNTYLH